jgi:hypothetical protein
VRGPAWRAALLGAATAAAATFATRALRAAVARRVPEPSAGFVEDALVLGAGTALLARMGALQPRRQLELGIA